MGALPARVLLEELYRRSRARRATTESLQEKRERFLATRFDKQRALIRSKALRRIGFCPRRSGKTGANAGLLLDGALDDVPGFVIFVAKTGRRAYDLTWDAVAEGCRQFDIPSKPNESIFSREFPNGKEIRWVGADNIEALRTKRGDQVRRVVIDECQDLDFHILKTLIDDIYGPSLEDVGGDIILTGTPGEVCAGMWYGLTGDDPDPLMRAPGWEQWDRHVWTPLDNPHVPRIHQRMRSGDLAKTYGGEDSPTYQREWLGKWVRDTGGLFYRYNPVRNLHQHPEKHFEGAAWQHVIGWDLGSDDDMAVVCWAFRDEEPVLYEAFSWKKPGALSSEVANVIKGLRKRFNVVAQVADTGGGAKAFVEEVRKRFQLDFEPAKKTDKNGHVRLMNDDLLRGVVKLRSGSEYAKEIAVLPKVKDWNEAEKEEPAPEDPRFANHCCDAGLYSWRRAFAYLHEPAEDRPAKGTPEAYEIEEEEIWERQRSRTSSSEPWWEKGI